MKITPNFNIFKIQNNNTQRKNTNSINTSSPIRTTNLNLQNTNYPIFCGGYSINLKETYNHLSENDYPGGIKAKVEETLENPDNTKTLYDVHFEKYKGINDCFDLEELKEKYPEFNGVISAYDADTKDKSFLNKWQNNESELFPSGEDLTLQLIKLYWGQGFSLNDLSKQIKNISNEDKGINLYYTMTKKLNIPLMNSRYANVLKLSNKEYNDKFTQALSIKLKEAKEAKQQARDGEPVFIPTRHLSESHKQHISESLKKYYSENPEAVYKMSERQKEFYKNNPDKAEEFSEVLDFAFNNTHEGKSVKKQLSKFFKKHYMNISDKELDNPSNFSKEQTNLMEKFWQINAWAREKFSIAMKKGWQARKTLRIINPNNTDGVNLVAVNCLPEKVINGIIQLAKDNGENLSKEYIGITYISNLDIENEHKKIKPIIRKAQKYINLYSKLHPQEDDKIATALHYNIYEFYEDLQKNSDSLPEEIKDNDDVRLILMSLILRLNTKVPIFDIYKNALRPKNDVPINSTTEFLYMYIKLCLERNIINTNTITNYLNKKLNEIYDSFDSM